MFGQLEGLGFVQAGCRNEDCVAGMLRCGTLPIGMAHRLLSSSFLLFIF